MNWISVETSVVTLYEYKVKVILCFLLNYLKLFLCIKPRRYQQGHDLVINTCLGLMGPKQRLNESYTLPKELPGHL